MNSSNRYLVHYNSETKEIQLRVQHNIALGFCNIIEAIPEEAPPSTNNHDKWIEWHDGWVKYFTDKYGISSDRIQ